MIGKSEFRKIPFLGVCIENGGHIFIERNKLREAISLLDLVAEQAKLQKKNVGIAPEGTRRRKKSEDNGDHLLPFKKGPFHMA